MSQYIWRYDTVGHVVVVPTGRQAINDKGRVLAEVTVTGEKRLKQLWAPVDDLYRVMEEQQETVQ